MKQCDIEKLFEYVNNIKQDCAEFGDPLSFDLPCYVVSLCDSFENGKFVLYDTKYDSRGDYFDLLTHHVCAEGCLEDFKMTQSEIILSKKETPNDLRLFTLEDVKLYADKALEYFNKEFKHFSVQANELVIVEISYEVNGKHFQELVITTTDWYDIYGWPVVEEHPEWVVINEALSELDQIRQQFIDLIQGMVAEDETIDFTAYNGFLDACDSAYVAVCDRHDNVSMLNLKVEMVTHTKVCTSYDLEKNLEDMTAQELLQTYRCLCEYDEWKKTGKISYQ